MISHAQRNISKRSRNNYIKKDNFGQSNFKNIELLCNDCPQKIKELVYDMWCRMSTNDPSRNTWNGKPIGNTTHAEGNAIRKFKRLNKLSCFQRGKKLCKKKG